MDRNKYAVWAFGDEDNDVEMIGFAGIGVAMGNGTREAKVAADYVTASVDDFDSVYDQYLNDYLNMGGQEIIDERIEKLSEVYGITWTAE